MPQPNLFRTSAFRLTVLYLALFSASMLAILSFIYWSTVAVISQQTTATIEAEILGLAEQYQERGLSGLISVIADRAGSGGNRESVYLLTNPELVPLAGNLTTWPHSAMQPAEWINLTLSREGGDADRPPHEVRARTFTLAGGYRLLVGRDTHEKTKFRQTVIETLAWSLAAALGLGLVGGVFLSRRVLARVETLTQTAQQIIHGDLSQRIRLRGSSDEFDRLAESLNAMFSQIERLMAGMRLATDSLAHDLRSPLTRLRGRIELALRQPPDPARDRDALGDVLSQTDATLAMFDNLLKIAAAESGVSGAELRPLDLAALAQDTAELYEPLAEEKGITFDVVAENVPSINAQRELLAQAVANLLDNAVKYTPEGGRITVQVSSSTLEVTLTVADSGPGIPEADRERVLDRFVRLEESRSTIGAGLGLSLVAAVAKLHNATLALEDNAPGLRVVLGFSPLAPRFDPIPADPPIHALAAPDATADAYDSKDRALSCQWRSTRAVTIPRAM